MEFTLPHNYNYEKENNVLVSQINEQLALINETIRETNEILKGLINE